MGTSLTDRTDTHPPTPPFAVRIAERGDLPEVLRVQRAAFRRVATQLCVAEQELSPIVETLDQLQQLLDSGVRTFVAQAPDGVIVGTVRATLRADGAIEIGRLAVDDGHTRRGIASALMSALEDAFPQAGRFELFTGEDAVEPLALYARLGYAIFRRERFKTWGMVWLAKDRAAATAAATAPLD